eukprot:1003194-Ditylum_brightwellii.AAC.1
MPRKVWDIGKGISSSEVKRKIRVFCSSKRGAFNFGKKSIWIFEKYPKRSYAINPNPLKIDSECKKVKVKLNFGTQCSFFREELNPRFPEPLFEELDQNIFCDADHSHNNKTG